MLKLSIIGLGLIGGSLARAFNKYLDGPLFIHAVDCDETALYEAKLRGIISGFSDRPDEALAGSAIVFICTPVHTITEYIAQAVRFAGDECIITDTGSTKLSICNWASDNNIRYIGGHPMAGSESAGFNASTELLFENAYYLLTPAPRADEKDMRMLTDILSRIGAAPLLTEPAAHDKAMAVISHVPHIIASTLVNTAREFDGEDKTLGALAAGGFRDITRIASSNPGMWNAICAQNKDEILNCLQIFKNTLDTFIGNLKDGGHGGDIQSFFQTAKDYRDNLET